MRTLLALLCALTANMPNARADILKVTFDGAVTRSFGQFLFQGVPTTLPVGTAYSASLTFNTDIGTITTNNGISELIEEATDWSLPAATITLDGFDWRTIMHPAVYDLTWSGFLTSTSIISAFVSDDYEENIRMDLTPSSSQNLTSFQTGICPGTPCGLLNVSHVELQDLSAVPSPTAGSGVAGLLFIAFVWLVFKRQQLRHSDGISAA